jgi:HK97 family phage major capsid protein
MHTSQKNRIRRNLYGTPLFLLSIAFLVLTVGAVAYGVDLSIAFTAGASLAIAAVIPEAEFQAKVLGGVEGLQKKVDGIEAKFELIKETPEEIKKLKAEANEVRQLVSKMEQHQAKWRSYRAPRPGYVSEDCARHLGGLVLLMGLKGGQIASGKMRDFAESNIKDILGVEARTALTSSDIPLPVGYQGDVVELVGMWGLARQYATVFPLGDGVIKLPRLKTDPTFGLIAGSGTVTEKSPQTEWVTFTAEKFGGLVRLPSEMDEDSIVPIGQFLARYVARQMAYVEDYQVFRSTGAASGINGTAEGLTKNVVTNSKTTASTGLGSPSEFTITHFRTLRTICDAAALRNGAYYLHPSFEQKLSSFNTGGDRPYNPQAQIMGTGANPMTVGPTLDGFPIRWLDVMPVYNTADVLSTVHVLFGDVSFQYLGVRGGFRFDTSTEAGFTTDEILVRALERLTTGLMATGAVGGLITAAA